MGTGDYSRSLFAHHDLLSGSAFHLIMEALQKEINAIKEELKNRFRGSNDQRKVWRKRLTTLHKDMKKLRQIEKSDPQQKLKL